jgi:superfamily II DNA helicase RecQ
MWDDEIVKKEESPEAGEEEEAGDEEEAEREEAEREEIEAERGSEASEQDGEEEKRFQQWVTAPKWTSDRMRRIMQQHSARFVGHRIGISAWRQIAVGIANRYLNRAFGQSGEGLGEEDEDDDGVEDSAWDLQAGHGTHVAGLVYARELQQGQFGTAARRDKFQAVSRQWHRFLGFGADDESRHWQQAKRKKSVFEGMREEARFRRFARLQHVDIEGQLRQMVGSEARFRGIQKEVIQAVIRGESPIVQITGTGGGKSMSFMLPAYCSPEGVTIVVVPLVALREDLHRRCQDSRIESHVWQGREANRAATVVFVTPESAVTKGFQLFVNRLQARQQLDRIVVDECHTVLDSDRSFRPQMKEVGGMIRESGVQAVFLTATLAPQDEDEFYHRIGLSPSRVRMFRARTTRGNIRYKVVTVDDKEAREAAVERAVTDGLRHYETGKVIVYSGLVEQAERLGTLLSCPVYHSKVDTAAGKARRMKEWLEETRVIVATNALGLGIDIPDVRLVVHAGVPRRLRDYAQESGRGGRDGSESEAVVIRVQGEAEMKEEETKEVYDQGIQEFAAGWVCRRVVLDRVMDGWHERIGCEQGEAPCDICERVGVQEEEEDIQEQDVESAEVRVQATAFLRCRSSQVREGEARRREVQREAEEVEGFRQMVESWVDCCVVCRLAGQENVYHAAEHCPEQESEVWEDIRDGVALMEQELFTKRQMEKFAGCFDCGMPQAMCGRWVVVDDDGGRFERVGQGRCQYEGLLIRLYVGFMVCYGGDGLGLVEKVAREEGFSGEPGQWYKWFGKRIIWGGIESSRLCRICYRLGQLEGGNR